MEGGVCHIENVGQRHRHLLSESDVYSDDDADGQFVAPEFSKYYSELPHRYQLVGRLGEGAFSKVFKAYDTACDAYIAIKVIDKLKMKQDQVDSVLKEIAIMRRLKHRNIAKLYGFQNSTKSRYCFLFLEYLGGGEIFNQIIKYTYFSEDLARHIMRQLAGAVKYLHDNGVVHRDIKPENLLFVPIKLVPRNRQEQLEARRKSDDGNKIDEGRFIKDVGSAGIGTVKLADFGLSTVLVDDMRAKTPCGTVGYTSPEQHLNLGYTKKVDLWAMGCVLYTLVVGFPPFYSNSGNTTDIGIKVAKGHYKFLRPWFDEVSQECKNLISNLLTVDPDRRYSIDELLADPWMQKGYDETPNTSVLAADAPKSTTFDEELFSRFNHDLVTENNIDNYFGTSEALRTPRAEAIRLVFDTGNVVQRAASPIHNSFNHNAIDALTFADGSDSLSDDDEEEEDDDEVLSPLGSPVLEDTKPPTTGVCVVSSDITDDITGTHRKSSVSFQIQGKTMHALGRLSALAKGYPRSPCPSQQDLEHEEDDTYDDSSSVMSDGRSESELRSFDLKLESSTILTRRRLSTGLTQK